MHPELSQLEDHAQLEGIFRAQSKEILDLYKEHIPDYLRSLELSIEQGETEKIMHQSHKLNSAMKTIGFLAAAERLQYIEQAKPDQAVMIQLVDDLKGFVETTLQVLDDL